jgi:succinylornithine aminotransferase
VRGRGLMQGMLLSREYAGQAKAMAMAAEAEGVMLLTAGVDVLRFLPALVVTDAQIAEAGAMLRHALDDFDAIQRRSLMPLS